MKILIAFSCPKNGWGNCSYFGGSLGRSICLKTYPKSRDIGACRTCIFTICIFTNIVSRDLTWLVCQQNFVESTLSDLMNILKAVKYAHIVWIPSVSFYSERLLTPPALHVERWSTKTARHKVSKQRRGQGRACLAQGQQLSAVTGTASQSAGLGCYTRRAWFVMRFLCY